MDLVEADLGRPGRANQGWRLPVNPSHAWRGSTALPPAVRARLRSTRAGRGRTRTARQCAGTEVDPRHAWMDLVEADLGRPGRANQGWRLPVNPSHAWRGSTALPPEVRARLRSTRAGRGRTRTARQCAGTEVDPRHARMDLVEADLGRPGRANQGWRLPVNPSHAWRGSTALPPEVRARLRSTRAGRGRTRTARQCAGTEVDPRHARMDLVEADLGRPGRANQGWRLPVNPSHAWRGSTALPPEVRARLRSTRAGRTRPGRGRTRTARQSRAAT